jgi:hypothetical protein
MERPTVIEAQIVFPPRQPEVEPASVTWWIAKLEQDIKSYEPQRLELAKALELKRRISRGSPAHSLWRASSRARMARRTDPRRSPPMNGRLDMDAMDLFIILIGVVAAGGVAMGGWGMKSIADLRERMAVRAYGRFTALDAEKMKAELLDEMHRGFDELNRCIRQVQGGTA